MATLTIEIKKYKNRRERYISYLVCQGRDKRRIPTGLRAMPDEVSPNGKKITNLRKARLLERKRRELQDKLDDILIDYVGQDIPLDVIMSRLLAPDSSSLDFFQFADEWLERSTVKGKRNYITAINAMEKFVGARHLPFAAITYGFLERLQMSLADRPRAVTQYLGLIRHLYREAMRKYNTDFDMAIKNDPFTRFRVPKQAIRCGVRALPLETLLKIAHHDCQQGGREELAHDCFIMSFCLMGINSVDLYNVTEMRGDTICYNRTKTKDRRADGAYIEVKVHPYVRSLVEKWKGGSRLFRFSSRYATPADFNRALNLGLKDIAKAIGSTSLSFYQARHTFATLSRNLMRFPKSDVDEALNHVGNMQLADIYIQKDFTIINDNNFKLIDRLISEGL